ncbi:uncharacterized protein CDAR_423141, partial [Caerostris darwini]
MASFDPEETMLIHAMHINLEQYDRPGEMERIQRIEEAKESKLSDLMNGIVPKLVSLALTKIAISMYQIPEIKNHEINSGKLYMRLDKEWEYQVRRKLNTLNMPPNLKTVVVQLIRPLSMEINQWMNDFEEMISLIKDVSTVNYSSWKTTIFDPYTTVAWKMTGSINRSETALRIIRNERVEALIRLILASAYCVEEEIPSLWRQLPDHVKVNFFGNAEIVSKLPLMAFWMYEFDLAPSSYQIFFIGKQTPRLNDIPLNTRAFHYAERKYEKSTLLTVVYDFSEKKDRLAIATSKLEVLEYCYQWMTDFEQERVAYGNTFWLLFYFLRWPYPHYFLDAAKRIVKYLSVYEFGLLMYEFYHFSIRQDWGFFNYKELFKEFWQICPSTLKQMSEEDPNYFFLPELLPEEFIESCKDSSDDNDDTPVPLKEDIVDIPVALKKDAGGAAEETRKDAGVTSDESSKYAAVTSDESRKDAGVTSDESRKDAGVTSDE